MSKFSQGAKINNVYFNSEEIAFEYCLSTDEMMRELAVHFFAINVHDCALMLNKALVTFAETSNCTIPVFPSRHSDCILKSDRSEASKLAVGEKKA